MGDSLGIGTIVLECFNQGLTTVVIFCTIYVLEMLDMVADFRP